MARELAVAGRATVPRGQAMKSPKRAKSSIVKRPIAVAGRKTSISLEDQFWEALREIATERGTTLSDLVTSIQSRTARGQPVVSNSPLRARLLSRSDCRTHAERMKEESPGRSPLSWALASPGERRCQRQRSGKHCRVFILDRSPALGCDPRATGGGKVRAATP
jgi:predicted DNA-binding ribbon-helix-helix protein